MHNETKTSCIHGHLYDDDNTYIDSRGHRHCRACRRAQYREWQKSNPAKVNAKNKLRKAKEKDLAPQLSSSEQELIRRTYHLSDNLGPGWHVDHIIPLALEGLHHPNNLQIISASENCQKQANDGYHPSIAVVVNCDKITLKCQGGMVEII